MASDSAARLEALIKKIQPRFRLRFLKMVRDLENHWSLRELERILELNRPEDIIHTVEQMSRKMSQEWGTSYRVAGAEAADVISEGIRVIVSFDEMNSRAVRIMQENQLRMVREFTNSQRLSVREAMAEAVRRGLNPRDAARMFRDSIGLTQRQMQAVNNYRRLLEQNSSAALTRQLRDRRFDRTVARATRTGEPLTRAQIDRMVARYRERYIKYRAETIARTESLRAAHAGTHEMYQQAVDDGTLRADRVTQTWVTAADERVRGSHASMHGQLQPLGQPFVSGAGFNLLYPGDPNAPASETVQCRCVVTTRFFGE